MSKATVMLGIILSATSVNAFCNTFTIIPQTYTERGSTITNLTNLTVAAAYEYRISPSIICNATAAADSPNCIDDTCQPQITAGTMVNQDGVANITLNADDKASLFSLIAHTAEIPFLLEASTTMGAPGAETYDSCISPTWAGYLTFTPLLNCVNGALSGCSGSEVDEGAIVRTCAPLAPQGQLSGAIFFQQSDDSTAEAVGSVPDPTVPEEEVPHGSLVSPSPVASTFVETAVPGSA